jgi:hypothetical protein
LAVFSDLSNVCRKVDFAVAGTFFLICKAFQMIATLSLHKGRCQQSGTAPEDYE